ncbi:MAG TPA: type II secretion system F family protein [Xanthobacteraceae bacterium]|nr:type II secretion system F family protein [Xanthobacteraceae bacterium]
MWVIYALIVGAVLLGVQGAVLMFRNRKMDAAVNRRLMLTAQGASPGAVLETLRRERGFGDFDRPFLRNLSDFWTQTGLRFDINKLAFACFALSLTFFLVFTLLLGFSVIALLLSVVCAIGTLVLFLQGVRRKRIAQFTEQLPNAIEVIVRGVKVGYPFSSALTLVAREMPDPIGTEFGMTADEIAFGLDVERALENLYRRVGQEDLLFLIIAISIQTQTGGRLAEILGRLARLIRSRATLRLKVKALTAEGRLTAIVLTLMPFILIAIISLLSPNYFGGIATHPLTVPAGILGLGLLLLGNIIMYRMVHFKF